MSARNNSSLQGTPSENSYIRRKATAVGSPVNLRPRSSAIPKLQRLQTTSNCLSEPLSLSKRPSTASTLLQSNHAIQQLLREHDNCYDTASSPKQAFKDDATGQLNDEAVSPYKRYIQRCHGCGAYAEMCMACLTSFRKRDGERYKRTLTNSIETLFQRATKRGMERTTAMVIQWVFAFWKYSTDASRTRGQFAIRTLRQKRMLRIFMDWKKYIYECRALGAIYYARQQERQKVDQHDELLQMQGDVFDIRAATNIHDAVHEDEIQNLRKQLVASKILLEKKNEEMGELRNRMHDMERKISFLQTQAVDPRYLESLQNDVTNYKHLSILMSNTILQGMDNQLEQLSTSYGRQSLGFTPSTVFSQDLQEAIENPENPILYTSNTDVMLSTNASPTARNTKPNSFFSSHETPVDRAEQILMHWVNELVQHHQPAWLGAPRITDFDSSFADGKVYIALTKSLHHAMTRIKSIRPSTATGMAQSRLEVASVLRENGEELTEIGMDRYLERMKMDSPPENKLELMLNTIGQAMWLPVGLIQSKDVVAGDAEANFAALSYLFATFSPCREDQTSRQLNEIQVRLEAVKMKWKTLRETLNKASNKPPVGTIAAINVEHSASAKMKLVFSQTMEIKRELDIVDAQSMENHIVWWQSMRIILRKCFASMSKMAKGKPGIMSTLHQKAMSNGVNTESFAKLPGKKLTDLIMSYEDVNWELKLLQSFLSNCYLDLARTYRFYSKQTGRQAKKTATGMENEGGGKAEGKKRRHVINNNTNPEFLTIGEFCQLIRDCRVTDNGVSTAEVHEIMKGMDPRHSANRENRALTPAEYIELLIRVARRKYPIDGNRFSLSETFCLLVENFIQPYAHRGDIDLFKKQLEDPKVRRLLVRFNGDCRILFDRYATDSIKKPHSRPKLSGSMFSQLVVDQNIQDLALTNEKVLAIVQKVVTSDTLGSSSSSLDMPPIDMEMTFEQFEEALVALACHKFPDPYLSLPNRVEKFFNSHVKDNRNFWEPQK